MAIPDSEVLFFPTANQREYLLKERFSPHVEDYVRRRSKEQKLTGSITLDYSQGTLVAVTVNRKVTGSN